MLDEPPLCHRFRGVDEVVLRLGLARVPSRLVREGFMYSTEQLQEWFRQHMLDEFDVENLLVLSLYEVCGALWNCTDRVPDFLNEAVWLKGGPHGTVVTYSQCVRLIREAERHDVGPGAPE